MASSRDKYDPLQDDTLQVTPVRVTLALSVEQISAMDRYCLVMQLTRDQFVYDCIVGKLRYSDPKRENC